MSRENQPGRGENSHEKVKKSGLWVGKMTGEEKKLTWEDRMYPGIVEKRPVRGGN